MATGVFLSRPSIIAGDYETHYDAFIRFLTTRGYRLRRLGKHDYTMDAPLRGVMDLMKVCKAAIILGYPQYEVSSVIAKGGARQQGIEMILPTPWNQIEATLAFREAVPVLVIAHRGVSGGVFDHGVTGEYVLTVDLGRKDWHKSEEFRGVFLEWERRIS